MNTLLELTPPDEHETPSGPDLLNVRTLADEIAAERKITAKIQRDPLCGHWPFARQYDEFTKDWLKPEPRATWSSLKARLRWTGRPVCDGRFANCTEALKARRAELGLSNAA